MICDTLPVLQLRIDLDKAIDRLYCLCGSNNSDAVKDKLYRSIRYLKLELHVIDTAVLSAMEEER